MTKQELEKILENFGDITVEQERGRFVIVIISSQFENMNEGQRQSKIWRYLLDQVGSENATMIEFVFTYSPSEKLRMDSGEQL